jgi:hypothetical protein
MNWRGMTFAALAVFASQSAQAEPVIPGMRLRATYDPVTKTVQVVDQANGNFPVLNGQGEVWRPEFAGYQCTPNQYPGPCPPPGWNNGCYGDGCPPPISSRDGLVPQISFAPRADGYDMTFTFTNSSNPETPKSLGTIRVPGVQFASTINSRDFRTDGKAYPISQGGGIVTGNWTYPGDVYAPLIFLQDAGANPYLIGVSVQYPIMQYKHSLWSNLNRFNWMTFWDMEISLNPWCGGGTQHHVWRSEGDIQGGETRSYVVSVRIMRMNDAGHPNQWLRLFENYREYFNCNFSYTNYRRDPRPMRGDFLAISNSGSNCTPTNDHGWIEANVPGIGPLRLDQNGWSNWVQYLAQQNAQGWDRQTLWAPTGMYCVHVCDNFAFQFATHWSAFPNIVASQALFQNYCAGLNPTKKQLGLWWGNSVNASATWDAHDLTRIIPNDTNLADDNLAFAELDKAAQQGVQVIGLDAFNAMDSWLSYDWLKRMQARQPQIRFCTESIVSDLIHTLAPTYTYGTQGGPDFRRLRESHALADFLNPGHEIWAQINTVQMVEQLGRFPTDDEVRAEMRRLAGLGYVAHPFAAVSLPTGTQAESYLAAASWKTSIPPELKLCAGDFNRCNGVSVQDLFDFLAEWFAKGWKADVSEDGTVSVQDLFDFMAQWFAPCLRLSGPTGTGPGGGG